MGKVLVLLVFTAPCFIKVIEGVVRVGVLVCRYCVRSTPALERARRS
jgi:hypothetical protein